MKNWTAFCFTVFCFCQTHSFGQELKSVQHLQDSVYVYYFDLFDDEDIFHWDTVPRNFPFINYRFCFKNSSEDTLYFGKLTTGDGRLQYFRDGGRVVYPNEYLTFLTRGVHFNGRHGGFSKTLFMNASSRDSSYTFRHSFRGRFSTDTVFPVFTRITPAEYPKVPSDRPFLRQLPKKLAANPKISEKSNRKNDGSFTFVNGQSNRVKDSSAQLAQETTTDAVELMIAIGERGIQTSKSDIEVYSKGEWLKLSAESGSDRALFTCEDEPYRIRIRWKLKEETTWTNDWLYTKRMQYQEFRRKKSNEFIKYSRQGISYWPMKPNRYRINVVEVHQRMEGHRSMEDTVRWMMRWYGIPGEVSYSRVILENRKDEARMNRALQKHFGGVYLAPNLSHRTGESYFLGENSVEFLPGVDSVTVDKTLKQLGFDHYYFVSDRYSKSDRIEVRMTISNVISPNYAAKMNRLYAHHKVYGIKSHEIHIPPADRNL